MSHASTMTHVPAIYTHHLPLRPLDRSILRFYADMRFIIHHPSSGFATHSRKPVRKSNVSQKARQMGIS